jgi:DNA-binding NarL/FixJ family response regulator
MISVLLVDDHAVVRAGLASILRLHSDFCVAGEAADGESALAIYRQLRPDVVVMDLKMPGMTGWQAMRALAMEFPDCRVLTLTSLGGDEDVFQAIQSGALGYILKDASHHELLAAIRDTYCRKRTMPRAVAQILEQRLAYDPLTARELDVLRLIAQGKANREAGEALGLAENTVKVYVKSILAKLDAPDRTAAALLAVQRGLIEFGAMTNR